MQSQESALGAEGEGASDAAEILIGLDSLSISNSELEQPEPSSSSPTFSTSTVRVLVPARGGYYNIPPPAPYEDSHMAINSNANMYSNFLENSASSTNLAALPRQAPSPTTQHQQNQVNGGAMPGMQVGMPMNAGQQMDLNHLYEKVQELSDVLRNNREKTKGIIKSAEEVMRRANTQGTSPTLDMLNGELNANLTGRIAELERALAREQRFTEVLKREQIENTKLIGEYETAVGTMVEQIRNYCQNNNMTYLSQKRHYNNLLQQERDAHLASRLDRDHWHTQTMKCAEMIRTAYRMRCEEEEVPWRVVAGLQNEVRAYRNALGMDPEKPEEEAGWEVLRDMPHAIADREGAAAEGGID